MWLDADDVIPRSALAKLIELKSSLKADVYMLKYNIAFYNGKPTFSYYRERILKNCPNAVWQGVVHECIAPFGEVKRLDIAINHKKVKESGDRNYNIYKNILKTRKLSPREQYYYSRELYDHKKYAQCIKELKNFINGGQGWIENVIDAHILIANCYLYLNKPQKAFESLTQTFLLAPLRANVCCKIGDILLQQKKYEQAIDWYSVATSCKDVISKGGFVEPMYYNYYPYLQMCYAYFCLNDNTNASKYNKLAKKYFCTEQVLNNEKYFKSLGL